ncbi:hypothetical protein KUCAC02_012753 [Chaenocephalus aceratus]|uniref:Uncharacterized protein n=1 Tax=Chaenocephalus aceratus TaxID=36190 RepID=A0ACB9XD96_CHAAC|nr:hypothetical protein KUCAC02_012753 [Chaenocephalus aceratus]
MLYNFFANSVAHDIFIKKQREMEPTSQPVELKNRKHAGHVNIQRCLELSSAMDLADSVIATLTDRRAEESWREIRDRASDLCTKANVKHNDTPKRRQAQPPRHLQEFVVEAQIERTPVTSLDALRTECFYPTHTVCISLTLPVTSAGCVRSFSCLHRIKNYLRNSSGDARNSNLGLLAINKHGVRSKALDVQRVIDIFASNHNNRRIVLL